MGLYATQEAHAELTRVQYKDFLVWGPVHYCQVFLVFTIFSLKLELEATTVNVIKTTHESI